VFPTIGKMSVSGGREVVARISRHDDATFRGYVEKGEPVIITDEVPNWRAFNKWDLSYLRKAFARRNEFAIIHDKVISFDEFAAKLEANEPNTWAPQLSLTGTTRGLVDSNAFELREDVDYPSLISRDLLDEINVWMGNGRTPMHFDGYDNLLAIVRGKKTVFLLEPKWFEDLYVRDFQWSSVDITAPHRDYETFPRLRAVPPPIEVSLNEGDMLYVPAHWMHDVSVPEGGFSISLNYWYRCQHGRPSSGFYRYFYDSLRQTMRLFGELNDVEKADANRRLRAIVDQLSEGRSPGSLKNATWSGGEGVFDKFRI
jgi:hypothetical protein